MIGAAIPAVATWTTWAAWSAVLLACLALVAAYSGLETAAYVMNKIRLELHAEGGSRPAQTLRRIFRRPRDFLAVILVGTNLANYLATFATTVLFVLAGRAERAEWYALLVIAPVIFIFCESLPKSLAQRMGENLAYRLAGVLNVSHRLLTLTGLLALVRGFAWLLLKLAGCQEQGYNILEHRGLAAVVAEGHASGLLTHAQSVMADRIMHINKVTLRHAMKPLAAVVAAPLQVTREDLMRIFAQHNYSRLPLLDDAGQIAGVLDVYDLLAAEETTPRDKAATPLVLPADLTVTDALYRMQRAARAIAAVADQGGKHVGIVTIKDLVEEIVGELEAW